MNTITKMNILVYLESIICNNSLNLQKSEDSLEMLLTLNALSAIAFQQQER